MIPAAHSSRVPPQQSVRDHDIPPRNSMMHAKGPIPRRLQGDLRPANTLSSAGIGINIAKKARRKPKKIDATVPQQHAPPNMISTQPTPVPAMAGVMQYSGVAASSSFNHQQSTVSTSPVAAVPSFTRFAGFCEAPDASAIPMPSFGGSCQSRAMASVPPPPLVRFDEIDAPARLQDMSNDLRRMLKISA